MRLLRIILMGASVLGFLIACGDAVDIHTYRHNPDQEGTAILVAVALALNFLYLLLCSPVWAKSRVWRLVGLWFDAKEKELRDRTGAKISN